MSDPEVKKGGATIVPGGYEPGAGATGGRRTRRGASVKQLKKMLKKAGLKTSGKKAALTKRAKKAHLKLVKKGGSSMASTGGDVEMDGKKVGGDFGEQGGRRRRSRSRGKLGVFGL